MFNTKKIIIIFLFVFCIFPTLHANDKKTSSLAYMKLGVAKPPGRFNVLLPSVGVGARFQNGYYGADLSVNLTTLVLYNYASAKGLFLYYPLPYNQHQLYFGLGPGVGCEEMPRPNCGGHIGTRATKVLNLEGLVGYEFRHARFFKTFVQIELSQPVHVMNGYQNKNNYIPCVGLSFGIGF